MQCPYCVSHISDQALACPHCTRDLYLFKPLLESKAALEHALAAQQEQLARLEARLAALEAPADTNTANTTTAGLRPSVPAIPLNEAAPAAQASMFGVCLALLVIPLVFLLLAHWVLLFIYDIKPLYLRIATLLVPVPFGFALTWRHRGSLSWAATVAVCLGVLSVSGMLAVTALIDHTAFLPQSVRDWRETFEYITGIGLSFFAGSLAGRALQATPVLVSQQPPKAAVIIARAFKPNAQGEFAIEALAKRIQQVVNAATPVAAGAASVYAGVKGLLG